MFSSVGGFRFVSGFSLNEGIYLMSNIGDVVQGFQTSGANTFFASEDSSGGNIIMTKLGLGATTVWSTQLTGGGTAENPSNLILDASYNSIVVGKTTANTVGNADMYISKFDSTGNLSWQRTIGDTQTDNSYDVALVDSGANIVVTGRIGTSSTYSFAAKFASSDGSLLVQKLVGDSYAINAVTTDTSGNMYLLCSQTIDASRNSVVLFKCQSDFTITWQKLIGYPSPSTLDMKGINVAVDSNNNVYVTTRGTTSQDDFLVKLNSSGTLQWQTGFNYQTNDGFTGIVIDSTNNIYLSATFGSPVTTAQLLKFDSSGSLTWGRGLSGYGGGAEDCGVNNISWYNGKVLMNGYSSYAGTQYGMLLNVADDGSGVGTYADGYVWGFSPFTLVSSSLASSTNSTSINDTSLTDSAGTLTASSFTTSVAHNIGF